MILWSGRNKLWCDNHFRLPTLRLQGTRTRLFEWCNVCENSSLSIKSFLPKHCNLYTHSLTLSSHRIEFLFTLSYYAIPKHTDLRFSCLSIKRLTPMICAFHNGRTNLLCTKLTVNYTGSKIESCQLALGRNWRPHPRSQDWILDDSCYKRLG